jgi:hypothetical protein
MHVKYFSKKIKGKKSLDVADLGYSLVTLFVVAVCNHNEFLVASENEISFLTARM